MHEEDSAFGHLVYFLETVGGFQRSDAEDIARDILTTHAKELGVWNNEDV